MVDMEKITSRDNQHLVNARKVRDGRSPELIFVEGRRLVTEALRSDISIDQCFCVDDFGDRELISAISEKTTRIFVIPERIFGSIADTSSPQGIILLAKRPDSGVGRIERLLADRSTGFPLVLFLNEINNPANLGAILRTAEAAGVAGVVISENSADAYSPKSLRSAMGSGFRLPIWENVQFSEVLKWANKWGLKLTAADIGAERIYSEVDWRQPRLLIFGSEAHGLSESDLGRVEELLHIPMENNVESLNLAVSAGIILFEAKRQRSGTGT